MFFLTDTIFYTFAFLVVYIQVFFLFTFFENRKNIIRREGNIKLNKYPSVTITVPCFNEEKTVSKTIFSLLNLNYPKDQLKIFLINDGSTDGTWNVIKKFEKYSNVRIFQKENGGKYTAVNLGLKNTQTEFVGCLDADSSVHPEALNRIMNFFEKDINAMAVVGAMTVDNPRTFIQNAQSIEYQMSVFFKKMFAFMGAIHVTPGPFTIFRKKVFDDLGEYVHAHNTEDMEIAYRMQKNFYKIEHCTDAYIYTNTPPTVKKLFKQRVRWVYGFINNTFDYRSVLFDKKYGNFALFTLPAGIFSILGVLYFIIRIIFNLTNYFLLKILQFRTIGFNLDFKLNPDIFFIHSEAFIFIFLLSYCMIAYYVFQGQKIIYGKWNFSIELLQYYLVFSFISPFWLLRSVYNTFFSKVPSWR
jgi:cellulose synthase/poly-beta-1,6-N-acetylglucosamine synthase-like glycosyltransferase